MPAPRPPIYLDYNATTPLDPAVLESMMPFLSGVYGNPSSAHQLGRHARAVLDDFRDQLAGLWKSKPSEVIFTSGGTESNNLALLGTARLMREKGRHLVTTAVEHHAVLHPIEYLVEKEGFECTVLPVDSEGRVDPEQVSAALRSDTILVSVMAANNEVGTLQPVAEIGRICREKGVLFHTDAVQWAGKLPLQSIQSFEADLVSFCAHKFHGPRGAGALFIRSPLLPDPILHGGGHENERRAGTENLAAIAGLVEAWKRFVLKPVFDPDALGPMADRLMELERRTDGLTFRGSHAHRLPNTVAFSVEGCDGMTLLAALDMEGICASSGSACTSGSVTPSHVLTAMGIEEGTEALVRFSLGRENQDSEIQHVLDVVPGLVSRMRDIL